MWDFLQRVNKRYHKNFETYDDLYQWSIRNIEQVWGEIWEHCGIRASEPFKTVVTDNKTMFPRPTWFEGAKLNFAENLLYPTQEVDDDAPAVLAATVEAVIVSKPPLKMPPPESPAALPLTVEAVIHKVLPIKNGTVLPGKA